MAATNLSFIYFLEQEYANAEKYADLAYTNDRYNAKALVNKGNCLLVKGELEMSKQFYLEAIGVEADCVEAIYNLGLVNLKMGSYQEAQQAFEKLHTIIPHNPEVTKRSMHFFPSVLAIPHILVIRTSGDLSDCEPLRANERPAQCHQVVQHSQHARPERPGRPRAYGPGSLLLRDWSSIWWSHVPSFINWHFVLVCCCRYSTSKMTSRRRFTTTLRATATTP